MKILWDSSTGILILHMRNPKHWIIKKFTQDHLKNNEVSQEIKARQIF